MAIKSLESYIVTNRNGAEAIEFYKDALGAKVSYLMTYGEMDPNCKEEDKGLIANAQLDINGIRLMLSDEGVEYEYKPGRNVTITIIVDNTEEAKKIYDKLSVGAEEILMEIQETFWSPAYANLVDKYSVMWQISTELEK